MTATAVIMMLVAIVLVWGGLAVSIAYLMRHPLPAEHREDGSDADASSG